MAEAQVQKKRSALFNPAGGVWYHLRARRHAKKLWEPFRWALGEWLLAWQPPEKVLLLVGPSAGYNLQPFVFERFEKVVVLEPDPVARWIFKRRLAKAPLERRPVLEFVAQDHLVRHPERLQPLLASLGEPALMFSNVLGQIACLLDVEDRAPEFVRVQSAVECALIGRSWLSFHDRVSGSLGPSLEQVAFAPRRWSDREVIANAYYGDPDSKDLELRDHLTSGFFPEDVPHAYFTWQLEPGLFHLIEGVCSVDSAAPEPANG
jgi:hypothetical protein